MSRSGIGAALRRLAIGISAAWVLAGPVTAEPGADPIGPGLRPHGPPLERVLERNAERLGLDEVTRESIRALANEARDAREAHHHTLRALHQQMRGMLSEEAPDEAAVLTKAEEIGRAETELQKHRLRTMLAIRALLSPEQRRELVRIHEEMRAERGDRGGGHREHWRWFHERE